MKYLFLGLMLLVTSCSSYKMAPTPNLIKSGQYDPYANLPEEKKKPSVDILYVTDRKRDKDDNLFYAGRSPVLEFGTCSLSIGEVSTWRKLYELTTLQKDKDFQVHMEKVTTLGKFSSPVKGGFADQDPAPDDSIFINEIEKQLKTCDKKSVFIFVHGFNNTFPYAAKTTGQLWHYFGRGGIAITYSWPSGSNGIFGYQPDKESGEFTVFHLKQMLKALSQCPSLKEINILAHSRGTDVTLNAMRELSLELKSHGAKLSDMKINNLVLAAADIDLEVFVQRVIAEDVHRGPVRTTFYVGAGDRALNFSQSINMSAQRLGLLAPDKISKQGKGMLKKWTNVSFVYIPQKLSFVGHSYFIDNPAVSSDLILLMSKNLKPGKGRPLEKDKSGMWILNNSYPIKDKSILEKLGLD